MSSHYRHKRDDFYDDRFGGRGERRRSRSNSRTGRYRYQSDDRGKDSPSRSRSQSPERRRHRRHSPYSRSPTQNRGRGGVGRHDHHRYSAARRHKDSRSPSRSPSHSLAGYRSRSPGRYDDRYRNQTAGFAEARHDKWHDQRRDNVHSLHLVVEESNTSSMGSSMAAGVSTSNPFDGINLPLPKRDAISEYYQMGMEEPFDKERIHREMEEKLRAALAKEGKVYPPKKPEASHPVYANDGSFIEIFKKMQEAQKQPTAPIVAVVPAAAAASTSTAAAYVAAGATGKSAPPPPIVGRRRGGKILKTGVVAKQKAQTDTNADPKDFWSLYLAEVNKYKNNACESDGGTRPLVK